MISSSGSNNRRRNTCNNPAPAAALVLALALARAPAFAPDGHFAMVGDPFLEFLISCKKARMAFRPFSSSSDQTFGQFLNFTCMAPTN